MVGQNAAIFPDRDTVKTPFTPRGAKATAHFLAMGRAAQDRQADAPARTPADIDAFLKEECAALAKFLEKAEARKEADAARAAQLEAQKCEAQRRREERRAASLEAQQAPYKRLQDFTPSADTPSALKACYAPRKLKVRPTAPPPVADLVDLDALRPQRGKGAGTEGAAVWVHLLHFLAHHALTVRPDLYRREDGSLPPQMVLHLPNELMAAQVEKNVSTLRLWTPLLEELGYIDARPHYTSMTTRDGKRIPVIDGTLYAIRLQPGHKAKLTYQDLSAQYRNLDEDRQAGRTAYSVIQRAEKLGEWEAENAENANRVPDGEKNMRGSTATPVKAQYLREQLKAWAVTPGQVQDPLFADPRIFSPDELEEAVRTVQDVIYLLPAVAESEANKRAALVGILGTALAHALDDDHSQRWYCKAIWNAWNAEVEGRGGLQVLAAQLARLDVDRHEWGSLKRPAALLNARLRAA
jgi:hypothetical protein